MLWSWDILDVVLPGSLSTELNALLSLIINALFSYIFMKKRTALIVAVILFVLLAIATTIIIDRIYGPIVPTVYNVRITSVELGQYNSTTKEIPVTIKGDYGGRSCTTLNNIDVRQEGNTFFIDMTYTQQPSIGCTRDLVNAKKTVMLDMSQMPYGNYSANVNGAVKEFGFSANGITLK